MLFDVHEVSALKPLDTSTPTRGRVTEVEATTLKTTIARIPTHLNGWTRRRVRGERVDSRVIVEPDSDRGHLEMASARR